MPGYMAGLSTNLECDGWKERMSQERRAGEERQYASSLGFSSNHAVQYLKRQASQDSWHFTESSSLPQQSLTHQHRCMCKSASASFNRDKSWKNPAPLARNTMVNFDRRLNMGRLTTNLVEDRADDRRRAMGETPLHSRAEDAKFAAASLPRQPGSEGMGPFGYMLLPGATVKSLHARHQLPGF